MVSHKALTGTWLAFSFFRNAGIVLSLDVAKSISAHSSAHDNNAPNSEMASPMLIRIAPHSPTTCLSTPAIDGFCKLASSGWVMIPSESTFTSTSNASTPRKPITVALPTSERFSALPEYTLAPSIPMNTNTVTSIMLRTWSITLPRSGVPLPHRSRVKMSALKATAAITINMTIGTIFAIVVNWLMKAASLIPRSTKKCTPHSNNEAQPMATGVLP